MGWSRRAGIALLFTATMPAYADASDPVVVQVGASSLRVSEVAERLAALPEFQRRSYGGSDAEIRRHFVDAVLVPEMLAAEDARLRNLADVPRVRSRLREALRRSLTETLWQEALAAGTPEAELRSYYDAHRDDYEKPEGIRIARILVDDEALARRISTEAAGTAGLEHWNQEARDHSLDAATKMRGGTLGFVFPDGRTEVPQVAVDPALYAAAAKVRDGELVAEPVKEGTHLAVVWRRGTLPKTSYSFEAAKDQLGSMMARERAENALSALRDELRQKSLKDENPALLEALPPDLPTATTPRLRPTASGTPAEPVPQPSERGLR